MGEVRENRRWHGCKSMDIVVHRKAKTQGIRVLRGKRLRTRGAWKGEEEGRGGWWTFTLCRVFLT